MRPYLVFDVNETLLDLSALDPHFIAYFGDRKFRKEWFGQVLKSAFASTVIGTYHHFGHVALTSLTMVAEANEINLPSEAYDSILGQMRTLPAHSDVLPGLTRLREAGYSMSALTNSPTRVAQEQIENAGLDIYMDTILSVDASKTLKPAFQVYQDAANSLGQPMNNLCLIAAHPWDIAGAMKAGWKGAFVVREGKVWNPLFEAPSYTGADMIDIATQLSDQVE